MTLYGAHAIPGPWADRAACLGRLNVMFTSTGTARRTGRPDDWADAALAICAGCDVLYPCRQWALTEPDPAVDAVAGGMTPRQRWEWHQRRRPLREIRSGRPRTRPLGRAAGLDLDRAVEDFNMIFERRTG